MNIRALRYYSFQTKADTIIQQIIEEKIRESSGKPYFQYDIYRKTSIDLIADKEYLDNQTQDIQRKNNRVYLQIIKPYLPWLEYARPQKENSKNIVLTTALYEDYFTGYSDNINHQNGRLLQASKKSSLYQFVGNQNVATALNDIVGEVDLFSKKNDVFTYSIRGPLAKDALLTYQYFFSGQKTEDGELCYEIVFYPHFPADIEFTGYLYISADGRNTLKKAVFSINSLSNSSNFIEDILFVQRFDAKENKLVPKEKKIYILVGDDMHSCFLFTRNSFYFNFSYPEHLNLTRYNLESGANAKANQNKKGLFWENHRPEPLTASETQVENLIEISSQTGAFRNMENFIYLLLTNHWVIGGKNGLFEWGNVTQAVSHNDREGFRFKLGGNTTTHLNNHFLLGGYVAYGQKDNQFKYRGDIIYSFLPKEKSMWEYPQSHLSFTYVNDLNIFGEDLLTSTRDDIFYSFSHSAYKPLTWQKIGVIAWEREMFNRFSVKIAGKYLSDKPIEKSLYNDYTTSEASFSFRYAPREKTFQRREKRIYLQQGGIELNFRHRIGLKGVFGSKYNYHITDGSIFKRFYLPQNIGDVNMELSAGKIWNRVPFPLLFILHGNQSYIFKSDNFNLLNFHEFVTDNFIAGNINLGFNWSPIRLFAPKNSIKTSIGGRTIYGPLSGNNNPALHSGLLPFSKGVEALGKEPYVEINAGLNNIFKIFRIEYVRRLTYTESKNDNRKNFVFVGIDLRF